MMQEACRLKGLLTTLSAVVAIDNDKLVGVLGVLCDIVCRSMVTHQWIRTSTPTLHAMAQYAAPFLRVVTHVNRAACKGVGAGGGEIDTLLEKMLLFIEENRRHLPLITPNCKVVF